jgi:hypothetical protein
MDEDRSTGIYGTMPMGLEFQTSIYAMKNLGILADLVIKKYRIINKGNNILKDMYLGYWSDPDLGDASDDYTGCDSTLSLGYVWNALVSDGIYGNPPPALGYALLQGPVIPAGIQDSAYYDYKWRRGFKNLPMTSYFVFPPVDPRDPHPPQINAFNMYNALRGINLMGEQIIDPQTQMPTKYFLPGDPETGTGWYDGDGWPGGWTSFDRRMLSSAGPINLSPGDTQEVVVGIVIAKGKNHKNSVTLLKHNTEVIHKAFHENFYFDVVPPSPEVNKVEEDRTVVLWWEKNAEDFHFTDIRVPDTLQLYLQQNEVKIPVTDKNYRFEGYRIWQYSDKNGSQPELIAVTDLKNNVKNIKHILYHYLNLPSVPLVSSPDSGLIRFIKIDKDVYTGYPLNNGTAYYFGVTAYAYSEFSDPPVIESVPDVIEVIPGRRPIDQHIPNSTFTTVRFEHISGYGDGDVYARIIDPERLKGHKYEVVFNPGATSYHFINRTTGDTLLQNSTDLRADSLDKELIEGFILSVQNIGRDRVTGTPPAPIRIVEEIKGPNGAEITPKNVFSTATTERLNSTGQWTVRAVNPYNQTLNNSLQSFAYQPLGIDDYEIRFTADGSEYYTSGYSAFPIGNLQKATDPKGIGRVPFEVWRIPANPAESSERLVIKIFDRNQDTAWNAQTGLYESIYTFSYAGGYPNELAPFANASTGGTVQKNYRLGNFVIQGDLPAPGTTIRLSTWKPLTAEDAFSAVIEAPVYNNVELAKQNINNISVFPNPYYRVTSLYRDNPDFVRFTNLPRKAVIRIFSLSGVYITKLEKDEENQYIDWNLRNKDGLLVGSGMYLAYIELEGIGTRVLKIAIVM